MNDHTECKSNTLSPTEGESRQHTGPDIHNDYQHLNRLFNVAEMALLEKVSPGYCQLKLDEQIAILRFLLLWSLFEKEVLNLHGSAQTIVKNAKQWAGDGLLTDEIFESQIYYFRNRYYHHDEFTEYFKNLNLRSRDHPQLVREVLKNVDTNPEEVSAAVLIIVYRIRNNLFHGEKWSYGLHGQLDNFNHANAALIKAIGLHDDVTKKRLRKF